MNVFDFDGTIYNGNSSIDFYFHCLKKHPTVFADIPYQLFAVLCYKMGKRSVTKNKETFFSFLKHIPNAEEEAKIFWDTNIEKIYSWYKNLHKPNDVVVSAAPDFLVREICSRLGINNVIASPVNSKTGKYEGADCFMEEKVKRFKENFQDEEINEFYSDSETDIPMAKIAKKSFMIIEGKPCVWIL